MKTIAKQRWAILLLAWVACTTHAQDLLVTNATLHTGTDQGVLEGQDILITDGRIARIGERLPTNKMIQRLDAAGRNVTPALFAGITVSGLSEVELVKESVDSGYRGLYTDLIHPEFDVRSAYNPHSSVVPITRVEGFGYALLAATASDRTVAGTGGLVRFDGGYRSFEGKPVIYAQTTGRSASSVGGSRASHWMLLKQAFAEAESGEDMTLLTPQGAAALNQARTDGLFVFAAHRAADILQVLDFARANQLSTVIQGGREAWMVATELAQTNTPVILNALDNLPADFDSLGARLDNAALLHKAGVTVMFSSGETHNARKVRQVAGNAVANGLPHQAAIAAIAHTPARVFGGEDRRLTPGSRGDLVIWSGDPLEVTSMAEQVIIGGKPDTMVSRQTLLRDRYLPHGSALPRAYITP